MKSCIRLSVLGLLCGFLSFTASAQIAITYKAYKGYIDNGRKYYESKSDSGKAFNLGDIGGKDNVYDVSKYHYSNVPGTTAYLDPKRTPFKEHFKSSTHCHKVKRESGNYDYVYYRISKDGFYLLGAAEWIGHPLLNDSAVSKFIENPPLPNIKFPLTFKSAWDYRSEPVKMEKVNGGTRRLEHHVKVTAAGTVKTPAWTKPCLVLNGERIIISKTPKATDTVGSMWYEFITKDGESARIDIDRSEANSRTPHIKSVNYTTKLKK